MNSPCEVAFRDLPHGMAVSADGSLRHILSRPNTFEVRGDSAVLFLRRKTGEIVEGYIDTIDLQRVLSHPYPWYPHTQRNTIYAVSRGPKCEPTSLHKFLTGIAPAGLVVDHRDHNGLNNRRSNLRFLTHSRNTLNSGQVQAKSGYRGVVWRERSKKWEASVMIDGKHRRLGLFDDAAIAGAAVRQFVDAELEAATVPVCWEVPMLPATRTALSGPTGRGTPGAFAAPRWNYARNGGPT